MTELNAVPNSEVGKEVAEKVENPMLVKFTSVVNTLEEALNAIPKSQKTETERMILADFVTGLKAIATADNRFKAIAQTLGIYETDDNAADVAKIEASIASAESALIAAGFAEDSPIVQGAIKGLQAELNKAKGKVVDNLPAVAEFLGVKVGKTIRATSEGNGQLAMYRPNLQSLKDNDWLYKEGENTGIVVHSMSVSEADLAKLNVKPASDTWLVFAYNGELQFSRVKTDDLRQEATITQIPENWLSVKPMTNTLETLSGFTGKISRVFGKDYHGNGWQGMSMLAEKFNKVGRVVKES